MHIASMRVENFLSFGEAVFDFEDAGLVLVEGENLDDDSARSNGSGKSAMIDALVWCLFGETLRGYKHDEVIHRRVGEGCLVKVHLTDGDELYTVSRARRHPKLKNALTVTHDNFGKDMSGSGEKETQLAVDRLLGCTFKTFVSSVVFGQDRAYRFSQLTDGEQKKILDEVIGVERFALACAAARKRVSGTQAELAASRRALERAETTRDEAEAEAVDLQVKDTDFAETQRRRVEDERDKLATAKGWVKKNAKVNVDALKKDVEVLLAELATHERAVEVAVATAAAARASTVGLAKKRDEAAAELKRHQKLSGDCPTCGQKVDGRRHERVTAEMRSKLEGLKAEHVVAVDVETEANDLLAAAREALKASRGAMTAAQAALNEGVGAEANVSVWRRRAADHEAKIAELEAERSPYAALAEKARGRYARAAADADQVAASIEELEASLERAEFWVKAFGAAGLRSFLIDSSLPLLNQEARRVSRIVTGGAIKVEFSATSEQRSGKVVDRFEVRVDNKHGAGTYAGNSAGERAKVDLCVGLAIQRLVASRSSSDFNVAFFDEVFDHLDSAAHERVLEVLAEIDKDSVFVVSHDDDLKAWFPASLRIVKRGGFSSVEAS